jgi:hypothetical protein
MSSVKFSWNFILSLPELYQYLSKSDTISNSQISAYNRTKLRSFLFKAINIGEAIEVIQHNILHEDTFYEKYEALNSEFSHIQKLVKHIEFDLNTDIVLIPVIVNYFENINSLAINEAILPHPTFKIIFDTLKKLKILKINYTLVLFHPLTNEEEDIYLPESLTTLNLNHIGGVKTSQFENIQTFMNDASDDEFDATAVNLRFSTNFPNLKKLLFMRGNEQVIITLEQFILPNSQLEIVEIFIEQLNPQLFNLLAANCKNLKSVRIWPSIEDAQPTEFNNYPTLKNVETLNLFKLYYHENELLHLLAPFPNIKHLIISSKHPLISTNYYYFKTLQKLKKLTIYPGESDEAIYSSNLKSNTITSLEFKKFESLKFWKFELLENLPNVNNINIDIKSFAENEINMLKVQLEHVIGWRVIEFQESINLYKQ